MKTINEINTEMYDKRIYQNWVDDMFDYLRMNNPNFTEKDVENLLNYAQDSLAEEIETNIQTYFHPDTLSKGGNIEKNKFNYPIGGL